MPSAFLRLTQIFAASVVNVVGPVAPRASTAAVVAPSPPVASSLMYTVDTPAENADPATTVRVKFTSRVLLTVPSKVQGETDEQYFTNTINNQYSLFQSGIR